MPTPFTIPMVPPGYQNIIIPGYYGDSEAHARLLIGFTLNEDIVALNKWATVVPTDTPRAYYPVFNSSDFTRMKDTTGNDRRWQDSAERPRAMQGVRFMNREFQLERYGESTFVGNLAEEYTQIGSLVVLNQETLASRALVWRSIVAAATVTDSAKYFTTASPHKFDNYFTNWTTFKAALEGPGNPYPTGYFGTDLYSGTIATPVIRRFMGHVAREIRRRTNGRVRRADLLLLANPNTMGRLAATEEMHAYLAQQVNSIRVLEGQEPDSDEAEGLPSLLYKIRPVEDATTFTLGAPVDSATDADYGQQQYVLPDNFVAILARPGSVTGMEGSRGFSSVVIFQNANRALKPVTFQDIRSERVEVAIEDMFTAEHVAPDCSFALGTGLAT